MIFRVFFRFQIIMLMLPVMLTGCLLPVLAQHHGSTGFNGRIGSQGEDVESPQGLLATIRNKYGPDQGLISGIQFYNRYPRVESHPYFEKETFTAGSVNISGREYEEVLLNYDLHGQQVILEYNGPGGSFGKIILISPHVNAFRLGEDHFEKLTLTDKGPKFYQVIRVEEIECFIHWKKEMVPTSNDLSYAYYFSEPKREYLITYEGDFHRFRTRRSFLRIFSGDLTKKVRRYLRKERILFRDASTEQLAGLFGFIGKHAQSNHVH